MFYLPFKISTYYKCDNGKLYLAKKQIVLIFCHSVVFIHTQPKFAHCICVLYRSMQSTKNFGKICARVKKQCFHKLFNVCIIVFSFVQLCDFVSINFLIIGIKMQMCRLVIIKCSIYRLFVRCNTYKMKQNTPRQPCNNC